MATTPKSRKRFLYSGFIGVEIGLHAAAEVFVARALGGWEKLVDPAAKDKQTLALLDALVDWQKEDKLFENQQLFKTPIVRNGRKATVGYQPEIWKDWE